MAPSSWEPAILTLRDVTVAFDGRPVLVHAELTVNAGDRMCVIGPNGVGKSTLLRVAAGLLVPDGGTVRIAPDASVAYVPQDYALETGRSVRAFLAERTGVGGLEAELRRLEGALAAGRPGAADAYADALEAFEARGGWDVDARIEAALDRLDLGAAVMGRPIRELSGGQQVRVGLAAVLAARHEVLLLDEPTNNLDLGALAVLEQHLAATDAAVVVVSHDRAFLDTVAERVVELDPFTCSAATYDVSFSTYRQLRQAELAARSARYRAYVAEAARLRRAIRAQEVPASRTADTRPHKDNDKYSGHFLTQRSAKRAGCVQAALRKRLDRLEEVAEPRAGWELRLSLDRSDRSGTLVALADDASLTLGAFRLGPLSLHLTWGERVALLGHNGAGKSLLVDLLTGAREPATGRVRRGPSVRFGVLRQSGMDLATGASGLAVFREAMGWPEAESRTLLAKFDLRAGHVLRPVTGWSPGERCRLALAVLMARGANALVLDEPTNHLDLEAQGEFEQALSAFDGTLLVVSHDREFLASVGVTRRVELADGQLVRDDAV